MAFLAVGRNLLFFSREFLDRVIISFMRFLRFLLFLSSITFINLYLAGLTYAQEAPAPDILFDEDRGGATERPDLSDELGPGNRFQVPEPEKEERPYSGYSDIPAEALQEMQDFFLRCDTDRLLKSHYNCQCLASEYLDERIRQGPIVDSSVILEGINTKCIDYGAAAGYAYNECLQYGGLGYDGGMSPEDYCQCIGQNYGILFRRSEGVSLSSSIIRRYSQSAKLRCATFPPGIENPFPRLDIDR